MKKSIEHNEMFIPQTKEGIILCMPQGGPIQYKTQFEADRHSRLYLDGYTGGAMECKKEDVI